MDSLRFHPSRRGPREAQAAVGGACWRAAALEWAVARRYRESRAAASGVAGAGDAGHCLCGPWATTLATVAPGVSGPAGKPVAVTRREGGVSANEVAAAPRSRARRRPGVLLLPMVDARVHAQGERTGVAAQGMGVPPSLRRTVWDRVDCVVAPGPDGAHRLLKDDGLTRVSSTGELAHKELNRAGCLPKGELGEVSGAPMAGHMRLDRVRKSATCLWLCGSSCGRGRRQYLRSRQRNRRAVAEIRKETRSRGRVGLGEREREL
ncbi:hypothetical protein Emed_001120 [Eimeria media]